MALFSGDAHFFFAWTKRQPAEILHDRRERLQQLSLLGMGRDHCSFPMGDAHFQKNIAEVLTSLEHPQKAGSHKQSRDNSAHGIGKRSCHDSPHGQLRHIRTPTWFRAPERADQNSDRGNISKPAQRKRQDRNRSM